MSTLNKEELKQILSVITALVTPDSSNGKSFDFKEVLKYNIEIISQLDLSKVEDLQHISNICKNLKSTDDVSWNYVCICLEALLQLKEYLLKDKEELLSISQQKSVRSCLELIITLGFLPNLLPGVGLSLEHRSSHAQKLLSGSFGEAETSDVEKYERICIVARGLWSLIEEETLNGLVLPKYLGDLLAVLCQLVFAPYKEPSPELKADVIGFKKNLDHVIAASYKPIIISELMLLQGNKKCPIWLKRGLSKLLTNKLMEKDGVIATVQAIQYLSNKTSPVLVTGLESVARLITTPHIKDTTTYYNIIMPQVVQLIRSDDTSVMQIGVMCCRVLYERDETVCKEYLLSVLMDPFINPSVNLTEKEIGQCLKDLYRCFAVPSSDMWSVPIAPLLPLCSVVYKLYCDLNNNVSNVRTSVEDLLWALLSRSNKEQLNKFLPVMLFYENQSEEFYDVTSYNFIISDEGGVKYSYQNYTTRKGLDRSILKLIKEKDKIGNVSKNIFIFSLNSVINLEKGLSEKKLFITEILAELAESSVVQKNIIKDPLPIIDFITSLIDNKVDSCDSEIEIICIALMLLSIILSNMLKTEKCNWSIFGKLLVSLPKLSSSTSNSEIKTLCDEVYNMMLTRAVGKERNQFSNGGKSECAKALDDACDSLLPVRGHAMIVLSKLIVAGDIEAKTKKDAILCIFQENLKHEDSYLYLTAIEGLASLAAEFPDTVLLALAEEYTRSEASVRLKVGESLMRVIRILGEMVPVYKAELLNSLLSGVRDSDHLVRASSLSNVGELCKLLGYRIGSISAEILNCVESVVSTDKAPEPRRAAVLLLTLLLRGLEKSTLEVLEPVLLPLYRTLKKIYRTDKDEVTRLHAQLAIEELDSAAHSFFFPKEVLSKQIFVLDAAP